MLNIEGPLTIYTDTRKAMATPKNYRFTFRSLLISTEPKLWSDNSLAVPIRTLRLRCLCVFPFCLVMFAMMSIDTNLLDAPGCLLRWALLAEVPILYFLISRKLTRQTEPILSVSSRGITVNTLGTRIGFLRWDEIKEIYSYRLGSRFVGITLNSPRTVYARIGLNRSLMLRMNDLVIPLYRLVRIRVAPINIPQGYLPMTGDELLAQIENYRATYA